MGGTAEAVYRLLSQKEQGVLSVAKAGKELFPGFETGLDDIENEVFLLGIILVERFFGDGKGPANVFDCHIADAAPVKERRGRLQNLIFQIFCHTL